MTPFYSSHRSAFAPIAAALAAGLLAVGCSGVDTTGLAETDQIAGVDPGDDGGIGDGTLEPGAPECGNDICEPGEHVFNCRPDCGEIGPFLGCLQGACPDDVTECGASQACADALMCLNECGPAAPDCALSCSADLGEADATAFNAVTDCMTFSDCIPDGPTDPVAPPPTPTDPTVSCEGRCGEPAAGDGTQCGCDDACSFFGDCCEDYESTCIDVTPEHPVIACLRDGCPAELTECEGDEACQLVVACMEDCDATDTQCLFDCSQSGGFSMAAINLGVCGEEAECFNGEVPEPGPFCGDGICDDVETKDSCPADCGPAVEPPGDGVMDCLAEECSAEFNECLGDEGCLDVLACLEECPPGDQGCLFDCSQVGGFSMTAINLGLCGQGAGCFDAGPEPEGPVCGDGVCSWDGGEDPGNCPDDCGNEPPGPGDDCFIENCSAELEACLQTPSCTEAFECLQQCDSEACGQACLEAASPEAQVALGAMRTCNQENCAGVPPGEDCVWQECGFEVQSCLDNADCSELVACLQECEDEMCFQGCGQAASNLAVELYQAVAFCYEENCEDGPGPDGCGNGQCEPGENEQSCPEDCDITVVTPGDDLMDCLAEECGSEFGECLADDQCLDVLDCLKDCPPGDQQCIFGCSQTGGFSPTAIGLGICGQGAGCFEGGGGGGEPECGNGLCEDGESANSCPQDCDGGGGDPGEALECIIDTCGVADFCFGVENCMNALECMTACGDDTCVQACADAMEPGQGQGKNYVNNQIVPCVQDSDCLAGGPGPGPGPGPVDPAEYFDCLSEECGGQLNTCYTNGSQTCPATFDCIEECLADDGGTDDCVESCWADNEGWTSGTTTTLFECSEEAQCHGGGDNGGGDNDGIDQCLLDACPGTVEECTDTGCWELINCWNACDENEACQNECWNAGSGATQDAVLDIVDCWDENDCEGGGDNGGGDNGGGDNGGGDNGGGDIDVDEVIECVSGVCGDELAACMADPGCADILSCALGCGGDIGCMIGCAGFDALSDPTITDIAFCAQSSGCL